MIRREDLDKTDFSDVATGKRLPPVTPGEILKFEFMEPLGLSARALARDLGVPPNRITEIVNGNRAISPSYSPHSRDSLADMAQPSGIA